MTITSLVFAVFCALTILIYWRFPQHYRSLWLFIVSTVFIITWSWELAAILLVIATVNFYLGGWLGAAKDKRRVLLWIGIVFNILVLVALKYSGFYVAALAHLLNRTGIRTGAGGLQFLVPIGLSFITVQMISYLIDIFKNQLVAEKRWLEFNTYVLYFPKFLSGPIERAKTFIPKLDRPVTLTKDQIVNAIALILIGMVRKIIFADALNALIPADAFVHPLNYSATVLFTWLLAYAFAIYNDFAGYSSMVRGISSLFGIELANNFNIPYLSRNFSEFWNRWHISLSNWLRDYIFFPISRALRVKATNRYRIFNIIVPPIVTMLVSGLWHGASWNLLLWGGMHGIYLVLERISKLGRFNVPPDEQPRYRQVIGTIIVFLFVILAWIPFRMDLITAKRYFAGLILPSHWAAPDWLWLHEVLVGHLSLINIYVFNIPDPRIILVLIPAVLLDLAQNRRKDELVFLKWPDWIQVVLYVIIIFGVLMMAFSDTTIPFIYQGF
jgi:D-alanyl-lipoteichoic acid acyltransferase DltB (MBOAT superfamily)